MNEQSSKEIFLEGWGTKNPLPENMAFFHKIREDILNLLKNHQANLRNHQANLRLIIIKMILVKLLKVVLGL